MSLWLSITFRLTQIALFSNELGSWWIELRRGDFIQGAHEKVKNKMWKLVVKLPSVLDSWATLANALFISNINN
jgi:hypothetical protein